MNPKGHWTKGKPRNNPGVARRELNELLRRIRRLIGRPNYRGSGPSARHLASHCRVDDRTVRRWVAGERLPDARSVRLMREYVGMFLPPRKKR